MKKILLLFSFICTLNVNSQTLIADDFTTFTTGNIGSVVTGATAGQGGYFTFNSAGGTNGGNVNYQVVASGNSSYGNAFQFTGSDAATGNKFMWKNGLPALWTSRTVGNEILEVEFEFFTGPASSTTSSFRVLLFSDEAPTRIIGGLSFQKNLIDNSVSYTNVISGWALASNGATPPIPTLYVYSLGPNTSNPQITVANNSWIKVGFSFNKFNGRITWKGPGFNGYDDGSLQGVNPREVDFISVAGVSNTVAPVILFDNFIAKASATDTLLKIDSVVDNSKFTISPNPTSDIVTINSSENIGVNGVSIADLNGRIVKELSFKNISDIQVNLSDLSAGMYLMSINSEQGTATKKILKN